MKQFLTVVAVGVLGAFLCVACGDKKPAETGGVPAAGTESAAPASTDTTAAPAASPASS